MYMLRADVVESFLYGSCAEASSLGPHCESVD